jgi:hypothetical protein
MAWDALLTGLAGSSSAHAGGEVQASRSSTSARMATDAEGSDDDRPLEDLVAGLARGMRQAMVAMPSG